MCHMMDWNASPRHVLEAVGPIYAEWRSFLRQRVLVDPVVPVGL